MKKLTVLAVAFAMVCMPSTMTAQKLSGLLKKPHLQMSLTQ